MSQQKSPKEVQNVDDDDESPKIIESSDEEPLEKSNTSKKLSFSNAVKSPKKSQDNTPEVKTTDESATRSSEKRSTALLSPTRVATRRSCRLSPNDSVENLDEHSAQPYACKKLSFADVAELPKNSQNGTRKAVRKPLSKAQNVDNNGSPRTVESSDEEEPFQQYFPIENAASFFKNRGKNSANMLKNLRQSYSALNDLSFAASPLVSKELIVKDETDNELIWQQISVQNKAVFKEVKKTLKLFGDDLKIPEEGGSDGSEVEDNQMEDEEKFENDDDEFEEVKEDELPRKKTKGVDLFNMRPQDLKNLDRGKFKCKLWLTCNLVIGFNFQSYIPLLISKFYRCEIDYLAIGDKNITSDHFKFLVAFVKTIFSSKNSFKYEDGTAIMLDKILGCLPKIQSIAFDLGEDISMINHSTMKNMIKLENLKNLQRFEFSQITEIFDEFENTHIWFAFASNISQEYKEQLDSLIDEIIKVKLPNCYITYDDQDVAKLEIMEGRYNGREDDMEEDEEFENSDDDEDMEEDHDEDVDMADID
uniref:Uncharacterized protein n=1 Tax=Panagrolaimus davidi TaxID=227884 RepID=A0A914PAM6_9BILA